MGSRRAKAKRGFGEISRLPSGRFRARYTGPDANRHSAPLTFVARIDAEGWLVEQERLISRSRHRTPWRRPRSLRRPYPGQRPEDQRRLPRTPGIPRAAAKLHVDDQVLLEQRPRVGGVRRGLVGHNTPPASICRSCINNS